MLVSAVGPQTQTRQSFGQVREPSQKIKDIINICGCRDTLREITSSHLQNTKFDIFLSFVPEERNFLGHEQSVMTAEIIKNEENGFGEIIREIDTANDKYKGLPMKEVIRQFLKDTSELCSQQKL